MRDDATTDRKATPDQLLAREIADLLLEERLVAPAQRDRLERGLADGSLTAEDWGLFVELADKEERR